MTADKHHLQHLTWLRSQINYQQQLLSHRRNEGAGPGELTRIKARISVLLSELTSIILTLFPARRDDPYFLTRSGN